MSCTEKGMRSWRGCDVQRGGAIYITIPDIPGHPLVSGTAKGMRSQRGCDVRRSGAIVYNHSRVQSFQGTVRDCFYFIALSHYCVDPVEVGVLL